MDLALASGRGESLLTQWPDIDGPLVRDEDAIQLGECDAMSEDFRVSYGGIDRTAMTRYIIQDILKAGIEHTAQSVIGRLKERRLGRVWLHVDLDVLDQSVMAPRRCVASGGWIYFGWMYIWLGARHASLKMG
jgi:arginase